MERKSLTLMAVATLLVASGAFWGPGMTGAASPSGGATNTQAPNSPQHFEDVPPSSPFYAFVQAIADAGIAAGYTCGTAPAGPCVPPANLPYYLPGNSVTRGQMAKFVGNARNLPGINMDGGTMLSPWIIFSEASGGSNITSISNRNNQRSFYAIANASNSTLIGATNLAGSHDIGFKGQLYGTDSIGVQAIVTGTNAIGFSAVTTGTNSFGVDVHAYGNNGHAVGAYSYGTNKPAVYALAEGDSSYGVYGHSDGANSNGVRAESTGNNSFAVLGDSEGSNSPAVRARSFGAGSYGLNATSNAYRAGYFQSTDPNTNWASLYVDPGHGGKAAQLNGDVDITGTLTVASCVGCFGPTGVMQNVGDSPIEPGDVVQVVGTGQPVVGSAPVLQVRKSDTAYEGTVVGVAGQALYVPSSETEAAYQQQQAAMRDAQSRRDAIMSSNESDAQKAADLAKITMPSATIDDSAGTVHLDRNASEVAAQSYGTLATDGTMPAIKVTAANGPIHAGDLLVSSDTPGVAMKADLSKAITGTVIGKALGALESGTGTVPVLITLK